MCGSKWNATNVFQPAPPQQASGAQHKSGWKQAWMNLEAIPNQIPVVMVSAVINPWWERELPRRMGLIPHHETSKWDERASAQPCKPNFATTGENKAASSSSSPAETNSTQHTPEHGASRSFDAAFFSLLHAWKNSSFSCFWQLFLSLQGTTTSSCTRNSLSLRASSFILSVSKRTLVIWWRRRNCQNAVDVLCCRHSSFTSYFRSDQAQEAGDRVTVVVVVVVWFMMIDWPQSFAGTLSYCS